MDLEVVQGDIARQRADALVTAAGTSLMMDTNGTGTALLRAGGEELGDRAVERGPIALGEVAVTDAFDLDAEYVIHAAAAHFGGDATVEHIRHAARRSLEAADERGCRSVVMPAIGCGLGGVDIAVGGRAIVEEVARYEPRAIERVRLIGYTDEEYDALSEIAAEYGP